MWEEERTEPTGSTLCPEICHLSAPKSHPGRGTVRQERLWGQLGLSFPGSHLPLSSCAPLSPSAGISPAGTGARTPLWGHREHSVTQTPNLPPPIFTHSFILLPGAGRGRLGCRPWGFLINTLISPRNCTQAWLSSPSCDFQELL